MAKILLIEDDTDLAGRVCEWLSFERHTVESSPDGEDGAEKLKFYKYELVVLDLGLPGKSGIDILKEFRSAGGTTPIIILTGQNAVEEKEKGLDAGADDYLTKPFHLKELSARVRALLRRPSGLTQATLSGGKVKLDTISHTVSVNDQEVTLLPKEFALLEFLMRHPNQVFSHEALLDRVWNSESDTSPDTVYTYIKTLRKKIKSGDEPSPIKTVHGLGYKFSDS